MSNDFTAAAAALNELGDKGIRTEVYGAFRRAAKPLGEAVVAVGSAGMPRRGGLSRIVAGAKMSQSNSTTGRNPGVRLSFNTSPGHDLGSLDKGKLRHPVFKRAGVATVWREQKVRPGQFTAPFIAGQSAVTGEVMHALETAAQQAARKAGGH